MITFYVCHLFALIAFTAAFTSLSKTDVDSVKDECTVISSCGSCITNTKCTWCVTKSKCTKQSCGNDNIIYPKTIPALLAGSRFCPKVVQPDEPLVIQSGDRDGIVVQITQIHLYMAFTSWKCKITLNDKETTVSAFLISDSVFCEPILLENNTTEPYIEGSASVLWDNTKTFDGIIPFKVCRCDLDPKCTACEE